MTTKKTLGMYEVLLSCPDPESPTGNYVRSVYVVARSQEHAEMSLEGLNGKAVTVEVTGDTLEQIGTIDLNRVLH